VADALGLVAGTVPATPLKYSVSLAPGQYAQLDDVVVTERGLPGRGGIQIAGVVTNVEAMHEGARFASDVFLIERGALPAEVCEVAEVTVTRVEPEMYVPPLPGAPVTRAAGAQRDSALYFDEMGSFKVPVGELAGQLVPDTTTSSQLASSVLTWKYALLPASESEYTGVAVGWPLPTARELTSRFCSVPSVLYSYTWKFSGWPASRLPLVYAQLRCQLPSAGTVNVPVLPIPEPETWRGWCPEPVLLAELVHFRRRTARARCSRP